MSRGTLLVISGPSGVGKTTIVREVRDRLDAMLSVSMTTRPAATTDVEGVDYYFVDEPTFRKLIDEDALLEYAHVFERNWYGTPREPVEAAMSDGRTVLLEIDVQGAQQVKSRMPEAFLVFIEPPSDAELERRLRSRGRDDDEAMTRRLAEARREIDTAHTCGAYDAFVTNEELARAIDEVCALAGETTAREPRH